MCCRPCFLRLVKSQESYDLSANPEAYLSRAAINASLDLMRSRSRAKSVGISDVDADELESRFQSPEAEHADRELQKLIRPGSCPFGKDGGGNVCTALLRRLRQSGNREDARHFANGGGRRSCIARAPD